MGMTRTRRALVVAAFTLVSCSTRMIPAATPTLGEAVTLRLFATSDTLPLAQDLTRAYALANPDIRFSVETGSIEAIVQRLVDGEGGFMLSNHVPAQAGPRLWSAPVAQDGIAVIVHTGNPVVELQRSDLREVFSGRAARWAAFGGRDEAIMVLSREDYSGTRAEFESMVMGAWQVSPSAQLAPSNPAMLDITARERRAVGYISTALLRPGVRPLAVDGVLPTLENIASNSYPLRALVTFSGLEEPHESQPLGLDYRAFIGWAQSAAGQAVVAQHYAPLLVTTPTD